MNTVMRKTYPEPAISEKEILRYAGCKVADSQTTALLQACLKEGRDKLVYHVCYRELPVAIEEDICDFGVFSLRSATLARNLKDCSKAILFAATVGVAIDRLIVKYGKISPAKALMMQAIGAERIEALCDRFCQDITQETGAQLRLRFSPGYGDLPLVVQKDIFALLDCQKQIGLTLNDSLLMSPSKSVTAFVGLCERQEQQMKHTCSMCTMQDCSFRGAL